MGGGGGEILGGVLGGGQKKGRRIYVPHMRAGDWCLPHFSKG